MDNTINICFEYQLRTADCRFVDDYLTKDDYDKANNLLFNSFGNWYNKFPESFSYKNVFIPECIKFQFLSTHTIELQLIFVVFFKKVEKLNIFVSKDYKFRENFIEVLNSLTVTYKIEKIDIHLHQIYKQPTMIKKDLLIKSLLRKTIMFINNVVKYFFHSDGSRIFIQYYHSSLSLIQQLDSYFVSDYFPKDLKHILNNKGTLYFNPIITNSLNMTQKVKYPLSNFDNLEDLISNLLFQFYITNKLKFETIIDNIDKNFKTFNVTNAIINTELPFVNQVISQVVKHKGGNTYLLNHGIRTYSQCHYHEQHKNYDGVLCWSEYEQKKYSLIDSNIKCTKFGYPLYSNRREPFVYENKMNPNICILPDMHFELWDVNYAKALDSLLILIKKLKDYGFTKIHIKLHPGVMNKKFFVELLSEYISEDHIYMNEKISDIIQISDVLIGPVSTAFYDCIFLNKPYLVYYDEEKFNSNIFEELNCEVYNSELLDKLIDNITNIDNNRYDKLKEELVYHNDINFMVSTIRDCFE